MHTACTHGEIGPVLLDPDLKWKKPHSWYRSVMRLCFGSLVCPLLHLFPPPPAPLGLGEEGPSSLRARDRSTPKSECKKPHSWCKLRGKCGFLCWKVRFLVLESA
eukprot:658702-Rhodomonas_salina.1